MGHTRPRTQPARCGVGRGLGQVRRPPTLASGWSPQPQGRVPEDPVHRASAPRPGGGRVQLRVGWPFAPCHPPSPPKLSWGCAPPQTLGQGPGEVSRLLCGSWRGKSLSRPTFWIKRLSFRVTQGTKLRLMGTSRTPGPSAGMAFPEVLTWRAGPEPLELPGHKFYRERGCPSLQAPLPP